MSDVLLMGPENVLAHEALLALIQGGPGLSPLLIHGPSGVGKSRLLTELVQRFLEERPEAAVVHLPAETFAARCASARSIDDWAELRGRFRDVDLFALDDLDAFERAPAALEELAATLDALDARGALVAATAKTGPGQWSDWPRRLTSRLSAGLAVRVGPPSRATQRRYLLERARERGARMTADAVDVLTDMADGYRTLDGWLSVLLLEAKTTGRPIDAADALALVNATDNAPETPSLDEIIRRVAALFGVTPHALRSAHRGRAAVEARHLAMLLARRVTGQSFGAIAASFGGRDAKTARHACAMAERHLAADPALMARVLTVSQGWRFVAPGSRLAPGEGPVGGRLCRSPRDATLGATNDEAWDDPGTA